MRGRSVVLSEDCPTPIGPYSQAVAAGGLLFCTGQLPIRAGDDAFVVGSAADQARQCLRNLAAVCAAGGTDLRNAVQVRLYLTDLADSVEVNPCYATFFDGEPPARTTIGVAGLPMGAKVGIDAVVAIP